MNSEIFLNCFENALPLVNRYYYGIELISDELLDMMGIGDDHPEINNIKAFLSRYGERSFCYELYHQTRKLMENYISENPPPHNQPPIILQAELKKTQIQDIVQFLPGLDQSLTKEYIPDFILHAPGPYEIQEAVVEVKSTPELTFGDIKSDLKKIQEFITNYNYRLGIFLSINVDPTRIIEIMNKDDNRNWISKNIQTRERIMILIKKDNDTGLVKFSLNEVPQNQNG